MGLFGNGQTKEEKQAAKTLAMLKKYGLEELSDPRDMESVRTIARELSGNHITETDTILNGNVVDNAKLTYLRAIVEQNFMIIRQLDRLNKNLEENQE